MVTEIYLVRHCESRANTDKLIAGVSDVEITEKGRKQLDYLAERFKDLPLDVVATSPLTRARLTAEAVNRYHGVPVEDWPAFIEMDCGDYELTRLADMPEADRDCWLHKPSEFQAKNGESMRGVYDRAAAGFRELLETYRGKKIAVTTHGGLLRCLYCYVTGQSLEAIDEAPFCGNTSISHLQVAEDGTVQILGLNDMEHLASLQDITPLKAWF